MGNVISIFSKPKNEIMIEILNSFGIRVDSVFLDEGIMFDVYNVSLSMGQRASKVDSCLVDIGMCIKSYAKPTSHVSSKDGLYKLRIQKGEMPSKEFSYFYDCIDNYSGMESPIPLGIGIDGQIVCVDLSLLPNLLISGVPGAGKSMLIHSIILSLIKNNCDIYLSDPKMVEFSSYKKIPCVKNVSYSVDGAISSAESIIKIMNGRFSTLNKSGHRDFISYNKVEKNTIKPIVLIIDEWADLILQDSSIEKKISTLAQKGRAAGISVIIATQRPSAKVVSGLIKASFSGRVCLKVNSAIDSRIVLDCSGGESISDIGVGLYRDQKNHIPVMFRSFYIDSIDKYFPKKKASVLSMYRRGFRA